MIKLQAIGNLGADAVLEKVLTSDGKQTNKLKFDLAAEIKQKNKDGKFERKTYWLQCLYYGGTDNLLNYLKKGTKLFVIGDFTAYSFLDKENNIVTRFNLLVNIIDIVGIAEK